MNMTAPSSNSALAVSSVALLCVLIFMFSSAYQFWIWMNWQGIVLWALLAALLNFCANYRTEDENGKSNESN